MKLAVSGAVTNAIVDSRGADAATAVALHAMCRTACCACSSVIRGWACAHAATASGSAWGLGIIATLTEHVEITETNPAYG